MLEVELLDFDDELELEELEELEEFDEFDEPDELEEPEEPQPARQKASTQAPSAHTSKENIFFFTLINHPYRSDDGAVFLVGDLAALVQFYPLAGRIRLGQGGNLVENLNPRGDFREGRVLAVQIRRVA